MAYFHCVAVADNCCYTNQLLTDVSHTLNLSALIKMTNGLRNFEH